MGHPSAGSPAQPLERRRPGSRPPALLPHRRHGARPPASPSTRTPGPPGPGGTSPSRWSRRPSGSSPAPGTGRPPPTWPSRSSATSGSRRWGSWPGRRTPGGRRAPPTAPCASAACGRTTPAPTPWWRGTPTSPPASINLTVHKLLTQPAVTPDNVTVVENDTVTLTCRSPPGTQTVAWLRDGAPVSAGGRLSLSPDNRTLTVRPAQRGDAGAYACRVSNAISTNCSGDVNVTVVYGPDGVTVAPPGPLWLRLGSRLELHCAAAAVPPPLFAWARGNASLATGSRLPLDFGDPGQAGEYRCRATNPALGRAAEATVLLLQDEGLPSAPRSSARNSVNRAKPSAPPCELADGIDSTEEVKYSTLTFSTPGGPAPHAPPPARWRHRLLGGQAEIGGPPRTPRSPAGGSGPPGWSWGSGVPRAGPVLE
ncbi:uncharacterized protein M6G45_016216 isoform 2-T2 [Spheniscus humboldti]